METLYILQVQGTFLEARGATITALQAASVALRDRHGLTGRTYRVWKGTRPIGSREYFVFGPIMKEAAFS